MNLIGWIALGAAAWCLVSVVLGLVLGRLLRSAHGRSGSAEAIVPVRDATAQPEPPGRRRRGAGMAECVAVEPSSRTRSTSSRAQH